MLALLVFFAGVVSSYFYASLQMNNIIENLSRQNDILALSLIEQNTKTLRNAKNKAKKDEFKPLILAGNAKSDQWFVDNSLALALDKNKTVIRFSMDDSSKTGTSYDLSASMQEVFFSGRPFIDWGGIKEFAPYIRIYSVHPFMSAPFKDIFVSTSPIGWVVLEFLFGFLLSGIFFFLIGLKGKKNKNSIILQKEAFFLRIEEALADVDFEELRDLLTDSPGVYENFRKYILQINEVNNKARAFQESLQIQIKKMVELIEPLTLGKWSMTIDVPPGLLTPIAECINQIANKARVASGDISEEVLTPPEKKSTEKELEVPNFDSDSNPIEKIEESGFLDTAEPESEKISMVNKNPWTSAISESSQNIDYLEAQLKLIAKIVPPIFTQIEDLYERELNNKLVSGSEYNAISLKSLERLISEKSTTMGTLHNIRKMVNELVMLRNWVDLKLSGESQRYSSHTN